MRSCTCARLSTGRFSSHETACSLEFAADRRGRRCVHALAGFSFCWHFTVAAQVVAAVLEKAPSGTYMFTLAAAVLVVAVFLFVHNVYADWPEPLRYAMLTSCR